MQNSLQTVACVCRSQTAVTFCDSLFCIPSVIRSRGVAKCFQIPDRSFAPFWRRLSLIWTPLSPPVLPSSSKMNPITWKSLSTLDRWRNNSGGHSTFNNITDLQSMFFWFVILSPKEFTKFALTIHDFSLQVTLRFAQGLENALTQQEGMFSMAGW